MLCEKCYNSKENNLRYKEIEFDYYHAEDCRESDEPKCSCDRCGCEFCDGDKVYIEVR